MADTRPPLTIKLDHMPDDYSADRYRIAYLPIEAFERGDEAMRSWVIDEVMRATLKQYTRPASSPAKRPPRYRCQTITNTFRGTIMAKKKARKKAAKKKSVGPDDYNPDNVVFDTSAPAEILPGGREAMRAWLIEEVAQELFRRHGTKPIDKAVDEASKPTTEDRTDV